MLILSLVRSARIEVMLGKKNKTVSGGTVHRLPSDLKEVLLDNPKALVTWESTTPLARNEWICLVTSAKQDETRARRLERTRSQLSKGQKRPCCWVGCIHRTDKALSPTQKWATSR